MKKVWASLKQYKRPMLYGFLAFALILVGAKKIEDRVERWEETKAITFLPPAVEPAREATPTTPSESLRSKERRVVILSSKNSVSLRGVVTGESIATVQQKLIKLSYLLPHNSTIYLVMDTPGGSIDAGMKLVDTVGGLPQRVETVTIFSASMGFHLVQHFGKRMILSKGTLMSHRARAQLGGQVPGELTTEIGYFMKQLEEEDRYVAARIGMSFGSYRDLIRDEYWVTGEDAVAQKMADEVVEARCERDLEGTEKQEIMTLFGNIVLTFSKCPLVSDPLKIELKSLKKENDEKLREFVSALTKNRPKFINEYINTGRLSEFVR